MFEAVPLGWQLQPHLKWLRLLLFTLSASPGQQYAELVGFTTGAFPARAGVALCYVTMTQALL